MAIARRCEDYAGARRAQPTLGAGRHQGCIVLNTTDIKAEQKLLRNHSLQNDLGSLIPGRKFAGGSLYGTRACLITSNVQQAV